MLLRNLAVVPIALMLVVGCVQPRLASTSAEPVAGLPQQLPQSSLQPSDAARDSLDIRQTRVTASRRELRVVFARDTASRWGWASMQEPPYRLWRSSWGIRIEGMDGPRDLELTVPPLYRSQLPSQRYFGSLPEVVFASRIQLCQPGMIPRCRSAATVAWVEDGAVALSLRDSAELARLFGMRPEWVRVWITSPDGPVESDSVRVRYVDPQIPEPDSAFRVEAARSRRQCEASVNSVGRNIDGPGNAGDGNVWMIVGDSATFRVDEWHCRFDVCMGSFQPLDDAGWTVADSSVVRLRSVRADSSRLWDPVPRVSVVARRVGRTRMRVHGLTGPGDTLPSSDPVARELEVNVVVTRPVGRMRLYPRHREVRMGETLVLHGEVLDTQGRVITDAPFQVQYQTGGMTAGGSGPGPVRLFGFAEPGPVTIRASFGGRADTLVVNVLPARPK